MNTECRNCKSSNTLFTKHIAKISGRDAFHYKSWCIDCGSVIVVNRTKDIFEKVKDIPWIKGNKTSKKDLKFWKKTRQLPFPNLTPVTADRFSST